MKKLFYLLAAASMLMLSSCSEDQQDGENGGITSVTDIDGNTYKVVKIGNLYWMAENLKVSKYNDGTAIKYAPQTEDWVDANSSHIGAWCVYEATESKDDVKDVFNYKTYGALYNGYAVTSGKLAPQGWRVPTEDDWLDLVSALIKDYNNYDQVRDGNRLAKAMADSLLWKSSLSVGGEGEIIDYEAEQKEGCIGAKTRYKDMYNVSGFSARPSGNRRTGNILQEAVYANIGEQTYFWSTTATSPGNYIVRSLKNTDERLLFETYAAEYGFAVRCVCDVNSVE